MLYKNITLYIVCYYIIIYIFILINDKQNVIFYVHMYMSLGDEKGELTQILNI